MKEFKDANGKSWKLVVNIKTAKAVRDLLNVDVLRIFEEEQQKLILGDYLTFINVLYVLCKDEADSRKMTDVDFGEALVSEDGDALERARDALLEEVSSFFPKARQSLVRTMTSKTRELQAIQEKMLQTKIDALDVAQLSFATKSPDASE